MKFRYHEKELKETIREQVFSVAPEEIAAFNLDHIAMSQIIKMNGETTLKSCALDFDKHGILAILMHDFKVDKVVGYRYFKFSSMQGIRVKETMLFYKITLHFIDGTNYVIRLQKRNVKTLPNQRENSGEIVDILHQQGLQDINNLVTKQNKRGKWVSKFLYWFTFIILLLITVVFIEGINNPLLAIGILAGVFIAHLIVCSLIGSYFSRRKKRKFVEEFNVIMENYSQTEDGYVLLSELSSLKYQPVDHDSFNAYLFSMSTALFQTKQEEEAMNYLDSIRTSDEVFLGAIEEQRDVFEGRSDPASELLRVRKIGK